MLGNEVKFLDEDSLYTIFILSIDWGLSPMLGIAL